MGLNNLQTGGTGGITPGGLRNLTEIGAPDSGDLQARYDATAINASDGDSVSTWGDETGNGYDLTAGTAPTYVASGINGNPVVHFNGTDEFLDVSWATISQPVNIYAVLQLQSIVDSNVPFIDGATVNEMALRERTSNWGIIAGQSLDGSSATTNNTIFSALFNGSSSTLRINGSTDASGDAGSQSSDGLTAGSRGDQGAFSNVYLGEILVYPQDKSGIQSDVESYLSDKWGITI